MLLLDGKIVANQIKEELKVLVDQKGFCMKYVAILLLNDTQASATYVNMKSKFGNEIGIDTKIIRYSDFEILDKNSIVGKIKKLNSDNDCVGIVVQLPLPDFLQNYKPEILGAIDPKKDIDGLGGSIVGLSMIGKINFVPATPASILSILNYYKLDDFSGKSVAILGQSNLIGKPLALEIMKKDGTVFCFNEHSDKSLVKEICKKSDYIISATGDLLFVNDDFVRNDQTQIVVDAGWGNTNGMIVGDVDFEKIKDKVYAITPVPGGVGPCTVACLFQNIFVLNSQINKI